MKTNRLGATVAVALAMLGASTAVMAQEPRNLRFTLGVKAWYSEWQSWFTPNNPGANVITATAASKFALIPTGTILYRNFFVSAGYFTDTTYDFPSYTEAVGGAITRTDASAKRKELDVNFGWYFMPRAAITVGYKQVKQDVTTTTTGGTFSGLPRTTSWLYTAAPTVGITLSAPIMPRVSLYGNGAYGPVSVEMNGSKQAGVKGTYGSSEFGVAWQPARVWTLTAGFKYQIVTQEPTGAYDGLSFRDVTSGWIFGALATF